MTLPAKAQLLYQQPGADEERHQANGKPDDFLFISLVNAMNGYEI